MPTERRLVVALIAVVVASAVVVGGIQAQELTGGGEGGELTRGEPDLEVLLPEPEVTAGEEVPLELQIQNEGNLRLGTQRDRVTTARGVTVEITDGGPFEVNSGTTGVGSIPIDGAGATVTKRLDVPRDLEPGEYEITVEVDYAYTYQVSDRSGATQERTDTEEVDLTVVVPDEPRFAISDVETDVEPGTSGDATLEIENEGFETADDLRATIEGGGGVTIDGGAAEEVLEDLAPGERTTVTVDAAIAESTSGGEKPLEATFTYRDPNGIEHVSEPVTGSLAPAAEQSFSITDLEDNLAVGYDGEITGEVTNDGPRPIDDAVLVVEPMSDSLSIGDTRYALPELKPGSTADFAYPTDVSGDADPGDRQVRFTVEYTGSDDATLEDGPLSERVTVDGTSDEFSIEDDSASVRQGESSEIVLEITNERPETLSSIDAMLYDDSPLSAEDDEAFVDELEPGDSAKLRFEVSAEDDAPVEDHPIELDFEYDTERGDTVLSDTYQYPITVEESQDDGGGFPSWAVVGLVVLTATGVGATVWLRRS